MSSSSSDHEFLPLSLGSRLTSLVLPLSDTPKLVAAGGTLLDCALSVATSAANASMVSKRAAIEDSWWVMGSKEGVFGRFRG